jgi:hypothetical protein
MAPVLFLEGEGVAVDEEVDDVELELFVGATVEIMLLVVGVGDGWGVVVTCLA